MSMTDPIADMITRIRNSALRTHRNVYIPHSKVKENLARILSSEGFIGGYSLEKDGNLKKIVIALKYDNFNRCVIRKIQRVSKPGLRVHSSYKNLKPLLNGQGIYVVSTSKGLFSDFRCRKEKIGGEILCSVY